MKLDSQLFTVMEYRHLIEDEVSSHGKHFYNYCTKFAVKLNKYIHLIIVCAFSLSFTQVLTVMDYLPHLSCSHGSRVSDQDQPVCAEDRSDSSGIPHQILDMGGGQHSLHNWDYGPADDCFSHHIHGVGSFLHSHFPSKATHITICIMQAICFRVFTLLRQFVILIN